MMTGHESSIRAGVDYLMGLQDGDGMWKDYCIFESVSDSYVTAFVASMLSELPYDDSRTAVDRAFDWLIGHPPERRWRFAAETARDADSTLWVLRLAEQLDRAAEVQDGYDFVESHLGPEGGIRAYQLSDYVERFNNRTHLPGWFAEHMCVTAGAAGLLGLGSHEVILEYLRRGQDPDGSWPVYWWMDRGYSTAFAAEALATTGRSADQWRVDRAVSWFMERLDGGMIRPAQTPSGSSWVTGLALRLFLTSSSDLDLCRAMAAVLRGEQNGDGSWGPSANMRAPYFYEIEPDDSRWLEPQERRDDYNTLFPDHHRSMTTALVVNALARAEQL